MMKRVLLALLLGASACAGTRAVDGDAFYRPARDLGSLFHDVQMAGIFEDSKTFVDARPLRSPAAIVEAYDRQKVRSNFDLRAFVQQYFELPEPAGQQFVSDTTRSMEAHITALWPVLTRAADRPDTRSSLIPLPHAYVVPGGRFREIYYWDSYFTMLGLVESGRLDLVRAMLDNFAHLLRNFGHIPNGNRSYYLSRSQPPFFAAMVGLYARATDTASVLPYLDALEREYRFWMADDRVVQLPNGDRLNRYWDAQTGPRPESYRVDYQLAQTLPPEEQAGFYRNVRAAAESGWDFSSRWMRDPNDLRTLETIALAPVDLNSLLYYSEQLIAALRGHRNAPGDVLVAARFREAADARRSALISAAWDPNTGFFYDVRWRTGEKLTDRPTMAAAVPLYFGLATPEQGQAVVAKLLHEFLKPGGFVTTLIRSGQQWDAPNGWPPLVWLGIQAACRYGRSDLAELARQRWLHVNRQTFRSTGKMMEKYDVENLDRVAGGGEYPAQDGFGWTNGVALALSAAVQTCRAAA